MVGSREVVFFYYQYVHFREVWEIVGSSIVWGREEGQYYLVWGGGVVGGADDVDLVVLPGLGRRGGGEEGDY